MVRLSVLFALLALLSAILVGAPDAQAESTLSPEVVTRAAVPAWHRPWPCCVKIVTDPPGPLAKETQWFST